MVRRLPRVPILLALLLLIAALAFPLPYVIVEPGDPQNVLGKIEKGSKKRLIEITGVKTFSFPVKGKTSPVGSSLALFSIKSLFGFITKFEFNLYSY